MIINCRAKIIEFTSPVIMGVLNVTPDSFYDGGFYDTEEKLIVKLDEMVKHGAQIIDIGALSSRPGSTIIDIDDEIARLIPAIKLVKSQYPDILISVDTFRSDVLREAYSVGADMVNDISGGSYDRGFLETIADLKMPYVLMHIDGSFEHMHSQKSYQDLVLEMLAYFAQKTRHLHSLGILDVIVDPGIGFSKSLDDNYTVLKKLEAFKIFEKPILVGVSRKSLICKVLKLNPRDALNGTSALNMLALLKGANILRVHDVKEAMEVVALYNKYVKA